MSRSLRPVSAGISLLVLTLTLAACGESSKLPSQADVGPRRTLTEPRSSLLPLVHIAPAKGWPADRLPRAASGMQVQAFAADLLHPRWLHVLPNGDVLVAESNAPPAPEGSGGGYRAWAAQLVMSRAGAKAPSANRITLLRDADGDGKPEVRAAFLENLNSPFGMALVGDRFYVANADAVWEYPYATGQTRIEGAGRKLTELPAGRNHHWTKSLIASADGSKLYATVGSNSNVAEHGMVEEEGRAAIWEIERSSGNKKLYASGLRNPNGMAWEPASGSLWTVVNERDELGSDLVPDYLTSVQAGAFYGWPYSWYGSHVDVRVQPPRPDLVAQALVPDYALGAHVAPLGLAASAGSPLAALLAAAPPGTGDAQGMFIGLHGSWNRKPLAGYKVIYVPFAGGRPAGMPVDVLAGFVSPDGDAWGRPVGVAIDSRGALLVADDVGNRVWRVTPR